MVTARHSVDGDPALSVVMPVHNALPHLDAAVRSVLGQSFSDFEFVILDDASTDGSTERLRHWATQDPRIRLMEVKTNLGPARSSDRIARAARAPIVARMDADDISSPDRLARQLSVLKLCPDAGVVGGLYDFIDVDGRKVRHAEPWRLAKPTVIPPFGNGPLMYRREIFESVGGYREECEFWEDKDLILRMSAIAKVMIIPHVVYQVRLTPTSTRAASVQERRERALDLAFRSFRRLEQGRGYDDLLADRHKHGGKLEPRVFISVGSVALWAGGKPRLFRRLLRRGKLSLDAWSLVAIVWTAWAAVSPTSLRLTLRLLLRITGWLATRNVAISDPVVWARPSRPAPPAPATDSRRAAA